jgi:hypothetical protein
VKAYYFLSRAERAATKIFFFDYLAHVSVAMAF